MDRQVIYDWRRLYNFLMIRWWELEPSESMTMLWKEDQLPRVKKEGKRTLIGRWKSVVKKAPGQWSKGGSCSFSHDPWPLETRAKVRDEEDDRLLPHPSWLQNRLTARNKNPHRVRQYTWKLERQVKFHADSNFSKNQSCGFWHPPVCQNCKFETRMCTWRQMQFPTCWGRRKAQQEVKERWFKWISCDIEEVFSIGLWISRFLSENIDSTWPGKLGPKHTVNLSKGTWHQI